ncbi:39S ribosomal protein L41 [Acropora cervicornis]|uniref:39S ribosomal protein L41 n=1 Tax=Acropora cervicornis TaxID=6130 RepID=A0AAD9VH78_ACRCE|nr:39S ribosomal protein L41 [Acropora cervicornis]
MPLNILRGLFRGASRGVMTGKRGNKNFYKGRGVRNPGYHTRRGAKTPDLQHPCPAARWPYSSVGGAMVFYFSGCGFKSHPGQSFSLSLGGPNSMSKANDQVNVGGYRIVYKKVPQFIVPDLTGFELKPYVSYKSPKVEIPPPTAESLLTSIKENIHLIKYRETP